MDNNNNPSTGSGQERKFFSGFLLGLLIGGALVFLLGTKKGKKLLKAISEEGRGNISDLLDKADKPSLKQVTTKTAHKEQRENFVPREFVVKEKPIEEKPKVRRFFRGISRRLN